MHNVRFLSPLPNVVGGGNSREFFFLISGSRLEITALVTCFGCADGAKDKQGSRKNRNLIQLIVVVFFFLRGGGGGAGQECNRSTSRSPLARPLDTDTAMAGSFCFHGADRKALKQDPKKTEPRP